MTILDSNVWIALFNTTDSQHEKAMALRHTLSFPILLPEYVVGEVCTILLQKTTKEHVEEFLEYAINSQDIELALSYQEFFFDVVAAFRRYPGQDISFVDCALLLLSRSHTIVTFDQQLKKAIRGGGALQSKSFLEEWPSG